MSLLYGGAGRVTSIFRRFLARAVSPQHNYKLDVQSNEQHQDEVDWRQYRESVLSSLPHSWRRRDDTWLELKHFAKQRRCAWRGPSRSRTMRLDTPTRLFGA
jgi:hypothetical protein